MEDDYIEISLTRALDTLVKVLISTFLVFFSCHYALFFCKRCIKGVRANCFCASLLHTAARANSHATLYIERARQLLKWTMIGQMAIAIALLGFNDLGCSVTPTFLFRNRFYLQLSPHCSKMNKKSMWEVKKNLKISVHGTWNPAILRLQGSWNYGL